MNTNRRQGFPVARTIRDCLIEKGLTPGTPEYKKAYDAEKWLRHSPEAKKKKYREVIEYRRKKRNEDPVYAEKIRAQDRAKKARNRKKRGDEVNEYQRKNYQANRRDRLERIKSRRYERDPARGLATLLNRIKRGDSKPSELAEFARTATDKLNSLGSVASGKRIHRGRKAGGHGTPTE